MRLARISEAAVPFGRLVIVGENHGRRRHPNDYVMTAPTYDTTRSSSPVTMPECR
ncbi:MAG TPA: hypothetical protein VF178_05685 [Gemmatimonadaceae bacterium]